MTSHKDMAMPLRGPRATRASRSPSRQEASRPSVTPAIALRWPEYSEPPLIPPPPYGGHAEGYDINVYCGERGDLGNAIRQAWSESSVHGAGEYATARGRIASQRGIALYATRLDALKALRLKLSERFGKILAKIDEQIAAASGIVTEGEDAPAASGAAQPRVEPGPKGDAQ